MPSKSFNLKINIKIKIKNKNEKLIDSISKLNKVLFVCFELVYNQRRSSHFSL